MTTSKVLPSTHTIPKCPVELFPSSAGLTVFTSFSNRKRGIFFPCRHHPHAVPKFAQHRAFFYQLLPAFYKFLIYQRFYFKHRFDFSKTLGYNEMVELT
jgi:hypothetical protein